MSKRPPPRLPRFRQGHYDYLVQELRLTRADAPEQTDAAVEILCRVFVKDNPYFRPDFFRLLVTGVRDA